jgi:hypothetical protein
MRTKADNQALVNAYKTIAARNGKSVGAPDIHYDNKGVPHQPRYDYEPLYRQARGAYNNVIKPLLTAGKTVAKGFTPLSTLNAAKRTRTFPAGYQYRPSTDRNGADARAIAQAASVVSSRQGMMPWSSDIYYGNKGKLQAPSTLGRFIEPYKAVGNSALNFVTNNYSDPITAGKTFGGGIGMGMNAYSNVSPIRALYNRLRAGRVPTTRNALDNFLSNTKRGIISKVVPNADTMFAIRDMVDKANDPSIPQHIDNALNNNYKSTEQFINTNTQRATKALNTFNQTYQRLSKLNPNDPQGNMRRAWQLTLEITKRNYNQNPQR